MSNSANVGCLVVGEYIDDGGLPANAASCHWGEAVRPDVAAECLDVWNQVDGLKEFTVLLKDDRVVTVRGQCLKLLPAAVSGESGSYGIVVRIGTEEILVGLFKAFEVVGIFHGDLQSGRKIA